MPTYEYQCLKCGHVFDVFQSMTAEPLAVCPKDQCPKKTWGRGEVKRAIGGGAGLIFKGSGFYITDYRSESYKAGASKDKPASDGGGSKEKKSGDKKEKKASGGSSKSGGASSNSG